MAFKEEDIALDELSPGVGLPARIRTVVSLDPSADALEFEGVWWPWAMLRDSIDDLDDYLHGAGIGPATPVGVVLHNRPETVRVVTALLATNRCVVVLSPAAPRPFLAEEITRLRLPAVAMTAADWQDRTLPDAVTSGGGAAILLGRAGSPAIADVAEPPAGWAISPTRVPGVAIQMPTSGTTGTPKRVDLLYRSLEREIDSTASYSRRDDLSQVRLRPGTNILWAPLMHIGGMRSLISSLVAGRKIALLERFRVDEWQQLVRRHRPLVVSLAPSAMRMVLDAAVPSATFEGVRAVVSGTAPVPPDMADEFYERYGVPVLVVYGATEFAGGVAGWTLEDWRSFWGTKRGSVGRANAGITVRVVDPVSGLPMGAGEEGVLEVKGPQLGSSDWVRTTDLGRMDEDGFIWVAGRADDVIIRGGFKVPAARVRELLLSHPSVGDASVIGLPDPRLGQVPVAAAELRPGAEPVGPEELRNFLKERLPAYQVPAEVRILETLPRTPSLKVSQPELRTMFGTLVTGGGA